MCWRPCAWVLSFPFSSAWRMTCVLLIRRARGGLVAGDDNRAPALMGGQVGWAHFAPSWVFARPGNVAVIRVSFSNRNQVTALQRLAHINSALLIQLAAGMGVAAWRRRGVRVVVPELASVEAPGPLSAAWPGWREFRVVSRAFEDGRCDACRASRPPAVGKSAVPGQPDHVLADHGASRLGAHRGDQSKGNGDQHPSITPNPISPVMAALCFAPCRSDQHRLHRSAQ